jgi:RimJ/RimL family protein N-acetyltransferase
MDRQRETLVTVAMVNFDLQPTLNGRLVKLRPIAAADFESLYAVSSDPLVWEQHPERFRYKRDVFETFFQGALDSKGALIALDATTGEVIGSSRFNNWLPEKRLIEVGYTFLARKCWGKGFNQEMKSLMLNHAFQYADTVHFYIGEQNTRSRTAIERIGAALIKIIERPPAEGAKYNGTIYQITKEQFLNGPLNCR